MIFNRSLTRLTDNPLLQKLTDLLGIILMMYISKSLVDTPLVGLAFALITTSWQYTALYRIVSGELYRAKSVKILRVSLTAISTALGFTILILQKNVIARPQSLALLAACQILMFKNIITVKYSAATPMRRRRLTLIHLCFTLLFAALCIAFMPNGSLVAIIAYCLIDLYCYVRNLKHPFVMEPSGTMSSISSYKLFSQMSLYVSMSFYLAIFSFIGYFLTLAPSSADILTLLAGVCGAGIVCFICYKLALKTGIRMGLPTFIAGCLMWVFALRGLYNAHSITSLWLQGVIFMAGIILIYVSLYRVNQSFAQVSLIIDSDISKDKLMQATDITQTFGFIASSIIMTVFLLLRTRLFADPHQNQIFSLTFLVLPFIFMMISIVLALKQPLDASALDKLGWVERGGSQEEVKQYLHDILIKKYRKRYGVRLMMFFVKPFIHHKVYGKENVSKQSLPAVFVCNHGEIYGPVTAVTHLPFYFKPWVHAHMLDYAQARDRIYQGTVMPMKIPAFLKKPIACISARLCTWALNSFDPVPVHLGNIRQVYKTMQSSLQVLAQGDSLLIFPENPSTEQDGRYVTDGMSSLYTGFAQIGLEYYKKYGKSVTFYPIYSSKRKRTFRIGEGIAFDPQNDRREEKLRIASTLERSMKDMSKL